jgi:hypothetical protein
LGSEIKVLCLAKILPLQLNEKLITARISIENDKNKEETNEFFTMLIPPAFTY